MIAETNMKIAAAPMPVYNKKLIWFWFFEMGFCGGLKKKNDSPKGVTLLRGVALLEVMWHCGGGL